MPVKQPRPGDLDPIETASRDEVAALQLERLRYRQEGDAWVRERLAP